MKKYRKSEVGQVRSEAKRAVIIAAAIDCIRRDGWSGMICTSIAERANVSMGKVFYHFPDMSDLAVHVVATVTTRDIEALTAAAREQDHPVRALAAALRVLFKRLCDRVSADVFHHGEHYRIMIERQLIDLIAPTLADETLAKALAPAALASLAAIARKDSLSARRAPTALLFVLNGLGIGEATAQRAIEAVS